MKCRPMMSYRTVELLNLYFEHYSESDLDAVFDKNAISQLFAQNETHPHSSVYLKKCIKLE